MVDRRASNVENHCSRGMTNVHLQCNVKPYCDKGPTKSEWNWTDILHKVRAALKEKNDYQGLKKDDYC